MTTILATYQQRKVKLYKMEIPKKTYKYFVYGLHIESEIECPELPVSHSEPDVTIKWGKVPSEIEDPIRKTLLSEVKPNYFLIKAPNIADYYMTHGNAIVVNKKPEADLAAVKTYLLGSAMAGILHQRAMFPFHGSAVSINGKPIIICGDSGAGKSTLVAELTKRGHPFISDDVSVITTNENDMPVVHPGYANIRLWKKSLRMLEVASDNLKSVRKDINKFNLELDRNIITQPSKVEALFFLNLSFRGQSFEINSIEGAEKIFKLRLATFRKSLLEGHGRFTEHFKLCNIIANHSKLYSISRNPRANTVKTLADSIENLLNDE